VRSNLIKKIILFLLIVVLMPVGTTGCYDRWEPDDLAYVLVMGFDKGVTDKLRLTLQMASFRGQGGDGGGGRQKSGGQSNATESLTVECPSVFTGINIANITTSRRISLMHTKYIVFSEEMARSDDFKKYIMGLPRYREFRKSTHIIICRGKATDFIAANKTFLSMRPAKAFSLILSQQIKDSFVPRGRFSDFYNNLKSDIEGPVAVLGGVNPLKLEQPGEGGRQEQVSGGEYVAGEVPREGGVKRDLFGAAVFRGPKMVGELDGDETRVLGMVTGDLIRGFFTIKDPENPDCIVALDVRPARRPRMKVNVKGDRPVGDLTLRLEGEILSVQSGVHYESKEKKAVLEAAFEQVIKEEIDNLVEKGQNEFRSDIFGFGRSAVTHFLTNKQWSDYNWAEKYPTAIVNTKVDFIIRRTGMLLKESPFVSGGEEAGE
jgi:spore germination protein KC